MLAKLENLVPGVSSPAPTCAGGQWTRSAPQVGMRAGRHSRRSGSGGLTSVYGKSPAGRQGVRLDGCIARAHRCGAPVDSSANLDRPRRQRPGSHAVGSPRHTLVLCGRCGRSSSDKSTITQGARSVDSRRRRPVHRHPCGLATAGRRRTLFGTSVRLSRLGPFRQLRERSVA